MQEAHIPIYRKYNLPIVGVYDVSAKALTAVREQFGVRRAFDSLDELLEHPEVEVVDIATPPGSRVELMIRALAAGKHILAQKPFAKSMEGVLEVVSRADRGNVKVAINQNGRWAPPWRVATLLICQGAIGEVLAISHLQHTHFGRITGTAFDTDPSFAIFDFTEHWIDIVRCWMGQAPVLHVRACQYRTPDQPPGSRTPWGMWVEIAYESGANALIRGVGCARMVSDGHPFWIHGSEGTIRGSVRGDEFLVLERDGVAFEYALRGRWYYDGFAGSIGELLCAIVEDREPYNSARHNLLSLQMTLAACRSADANGSPVALDPALETPS